MTENEKHYRALIRDLEAQVARLKRRNGEYRAAWNTADDRLQMALEALENSQSLLVSMLIEPRPTDEIEAQVVENRAALMVEDRLEQV